MKSLTKRIISVAAFICDAAIIYNIVKYGICRETGYKALFVLCVFGLVWCFIHIAEIIHNKLKESYYKSECRAVSKEVADILDDDDSYFITIPILNTATKTALAVTIINKKYVRIVDDSLYVVDEDNNVIMIYRDVINSFSDEDRKSLEELRVSIDELNGVPDNMTGTGDEDAEG